MVKCPAKSVKCNVQHSLKMIFVCVPFQCESDISQHTSETLHAAYEFAYIVFPVSTFTIPPVVPKQHPLYHQSIFAI